MFAKMLMQLRFFERGLTSSLVTCCYLLILLSSHQGVESNAVQSSTYSTYKQSYEADLATDGDPSTCSVTGWEIAPWWYMDLGATVDVKGVIVSGLLAAFNLRVGDGVSPYGVRRGFDGNHLCKTMPRMNETWPQEINCYHDGLRGRYISIQVVDNLVHEQLMLCDVIVY